MELQSDLALKQALEKCATEPIHQLGSIQAHGLVFVLSPNVGHCVIQVSENLPEFFELSVEDVLGRALHDVFGESTTYQVEQLIATAQQSHSNTAIAVIDFSSSSLNKFNVYLYFSDGFPVLELSNDSCLVESENLAEWLINTQQLLLESDVNKDLKAYFQQVAQIVRDLTAYDNVMIYKFDENWDGQVIAQSKMDVATDYLGIHFPASDIPAQARKLFLQNLVRVVTDIDAPAVALIPSLNPQTLAPLDMSLSSLRSLSPIHSMYLRNMGTAATMTISLLQNGKLWGLIACHHFTPKRISVAMREIIRYLSRWISNSLTNIELNERVDLMHKALNLSLKLLPIFRQSASALSTHLLSELMHIFNASGIIVINDGQRFVEGISPNTTEITRLLEWLDSSCLETTYATQHLSSVYSDALAYQDKVAGLFVIKLSSDLKNSIIFLRQEKPCTVNWAGSYAQGLVKDADGQYQLTPRKSFEIWSETWSGRSDPWSDFDKNLGQLLGESLSNVFLNKQLESKLSEIEYSHKALLNEISGGIIITDIDKKISYVNKEFEVLTGYREQEVLGKTCSILQGPDTDPLQIQFLRSALNSEQSYSGELLNYRKDGSKFWSAISIKPILDSHGQLSHFIGIQRDITDRKHLEAQILSSENKFRELADTSTALIWLAGVNKKVFWFNKTWLNFTGQVMEQALNNSWEGVLYPEDRFRCLDIYHSHVDQRLPFKTECRIRTSRDEYVWVELSWVPRFDSTDTYQGYICYGADITQSNKVANDFINKSNSLFYSIDLKGQFLEINQRFTEVTGYSAEEVIGLNIRLLKSGLHDTNFYKELWEALIQQGFWCGEIINRCKDGSLYTSAISISTTFDENQHPIRYEAIAVDITAIVEKRDQVQRLVYRDSLTGLPNRLLLKDKLALSMARVGQNNHCLAVFFINLDKFKVINDAYGNDVGDQFLIGIIQLMKQSLREFDIIARVGGDEFIVLLDDLESQQVADLAARQLLQACQSPITIRSLILKVTASIGISFYNKTTWMQEVNIDELIHQAEQAMCAAKRSGKNSFHYFDSQRDYLIVTQSEMLNNIQAGLEKNQFKLYYQPIVNLHTGEVIGFEGLIRWHKSASEILNPSAFMPIVQNHSLGIEIGDWAIRDALQQLIHWQQIGFDTTISINIDARQFHQINFVDNLKSAIDNQPLYKNNTLELEILETTELVSRIDTEQIIMRCREFGVEFSLDDFGTGYSSITYLKKLPIKTLKIDRSFIVGIKNSYKDIKLLANMIKLATDMGKNVVAEGIETIQQGDMLISLGCELGQGFIIAKPMPADKVLAWVKEWQPYPSWTELTRMDFNR